MEHLQKVYGSSLYALLLLFVLIFINLVDSRKTADNPAEEIQVTVETVTGSIQHQHKNNDYWGGQSFW